MRRKNESGQSTIEFALMLLLVVGFVFFYFQLAAMFAFGNYAHYATFMAARAFLSGGQNLGEQTQRAEDVLVRTLKKSSAEAGLDRFPGIAQSVGGGGLAGAEIGDGPGRQENPTNKAYSWQEGVRYKFRSRIFMISFGTSAEANSVTLTSESWLGRDPNYEECLAFMEELGEIDNGC